MDDPLEIKPVDRTDSRPRAAAGVEEHHEPGAGLRGAGRWRFDAHRCARQRRHARDDRRPRQLGIRNRISRRREDAGCPWRGRRRFRRWRPTCSAPTAARRCDFSRRSRRWATARFGSTASSGCAQRPIGDLLDALNQLGAHATSENDNDCPPVVVHANGLPGGTATIRGDISSQFLSGLLMAAPCARLGGRT